MSSDKHTQAPDLIDTIGHVNTGVLTKLHGREQVTGLLATQVPFSKSHRVSAMPGIYLRQHRHGDHVAYLDKSGLYPSDRTAFAKSRSIALSTVMLSSISEAWSDAVRDAIDHILLVMDNNPQKDIAQIILRPDVQNALESAGEEGAKVVISEVRRIWNDSGAPADAPYLNSVVSDATRNGNTFAERMTVALLQADRDVAEKVLFKDKLRAAAAQSVIETRSTNERLLESMQKAGIKKVRWQARKIPGTDLFEENVCAVCRKLDGTVVKIGESFNRLILIENKLTPYGPDLKTPPCHVGCRCRIEPA